MVHTILVIDSEATQRNLLCNMLKEKLAYQTIAVEGGREALNYVMADKLPKPDLILFDMGIGAGSFETIASLKMLTAHTPIICLVKYGDFETAVATLNAGAQDFLTKPVAMERMSTTFRNVLLLRDSRRETEWLRQERVGAGSNGPASDFNALLPFSLVAEDGNVRRMDHIEAEAIRFAMQYYNGRMTEVARRLGIGRSTLYRKLNDLSIRPASQAA